MDSYLAGSIVQAGATLGNAALQFAQNKTDKKFTREMYQRQLEDSRENWRMQNDYNSPVQQMARLEAAGLNPNLVYGQGAVANSSSQPGNVAPMSWHQNAPQIDGQSLNIMAQMLAIKKLQLDNEGTEIENRKKGLEVQKEEANAPFYEFTAGRNFDILTSTANIKALEEREKEIDVALKDMRYEWDMYITNRIPSYFYTSDDNGNLVLNEESYNKWCSQIHDELESYLGQDYLTKLLESPTKLTYLNHQIDILREELKLYPAKLRTMEADAAYEELKLSLAQNGINITDPLWVRIIGQILNNLFPNGAIGPAIDKAGQFLRNLWPF